MHNFLIKDSITIMGVMLSINCASASNIHLKLIEQEEKINELAYTKTKKEIKDNIIFCIISFFVVIVFMFLDSAIKYENFKYLTDAVIMSCFLLQIYAVYEITVRFILNLSPLID